MFTCVHLPHVEEPGDYAAVNAVLMFREGQRQSCFNVPIASDFEPEENEEFHVTLVPGADLNRAIRLDPAMTTVLIIGGE